MTSTGATWMTVGRCHRTSITLVDENSIELADIDATGDLTVATTGSIDDGAVAGAGADVNVGGSSTLTVGTTITPDDTTNDFVGAVSFR